MELVEDAFGSRVWTLSTPQRVGYARLATPPAYYTNTAVTRCGPASARGDPLRDARAGSAELWTGRAVAAWDAHVSRSTRDLAPRVPEHRCWRRVGSTRRASAAHPGAAPNGDVLARHRARSPRSRASGARWTRVVTARRRALPDAAHLDLIGQYLLVYTFDSPDPRRPPLLARARSRETYTRRRQRRSGAGRRDDAR
jgi:hypothetical protein